jgi:multidrug efflux pump
VFSRFFIDRPIFASVMSIVITLAGGVSVFNLPMAQYPPIAPPSIIVMCNYPGASAQVVAESVAAPIEQQVNGIEDMIYMSSQSANDGSYSLSVTFKPGVNLNFAQVLVQNRVNLALPLLPDVVKQAGVTTRKRNPDILLIVNLWSPKGTYDQVHLSNYATIQIVDELKRVEGTGDVFQFGQQDYSMRVWVDPDRLASLSLTAGDVVNALREQNMQVATGQVGQPPATGDRPFQFPIHTLGRLSEPEQFEEIVLRTTEDGRRVRIKDIGHVKLGARNLDTTSKMDGHLTTSIAVFQLPDANALDTANRVRAKMDELKQSFPEDIDYAIAFDTTPFIRESVREVFSTLGEAVILVAIVVLVFLQNWRSTLIPLTAVPVAIIGTFAVMLAIGFTLNNLTLFGLVLAIGIVVDDAIVVVEAVEHHIEEGMRPREAAYKAMEQVSGPVVAVALVLSAVFVPCAFISGITGQFFRQFALTIAVSTIISAFNSLTLSPALAAILLQPRGARKDLLGRLLDRLFGWFFRLFNVSFRRTTNAYARVVGLAMRGSVIVLILYAGTLVLTWWSFKRLPTGYIPNQDQGRLFAAVQLPDAASLERTQEVVDEVVRIAHETPGVDHTISVAGQSFTLQANGSNFGNLFITLDEFANRRDPSLSSDAIAATLRKKIAERIPQAIVTVIGPPPVSGLGSSGGFKLLVEDRSGDNDVVKLQKETERLIAASRTGSYRITDATLNPLRHEKGPDGKELPADQRVPEAVLTKLNALKGEVFDHPISARKDFQAALANVLDPDEVKNFQDRVANQAHIPPPVVGLFTVFRANTPQLYVDLNRKQAQTQGVDINDVFTTQQVYLGSLYVNDFNKFGRTWQVVVQAEGTFRNDLEKVRRFKVRNVRGAMVPLGTLLDIHEIEGPILLTRYNMYPAAAVLGNTAPGVSSGEGIDAMQRLCEKVLPPSMAYEWTEINYIQVDASKNIWNNLIFPLSVVFVFLVLAAQYESWALPLAVILVVPMCILGSLTGVFVTHSDINIFTQIGFVVLVGLASKNAILIVEFARAKHHAGMPVAEAALEACKLRLRPILMTSFAFILGVVPLLVTRGAGAEMRRTLGTAVFSGMLGVTLFGIFLTPVFFFVVERCAESHWHSRARLRKAAAVMFDVLQLGFLWRLRPRLAQPRRIAVSHDSIGRPHTPARNGAGQVDGVPRPNGDGVHQPGPAAEPEQK